MALGTVEAPWFYRQRQLMIGLAYGFGFFFGYLISGFVGTWTSTSTWGAWFFVPTPSYVELGNAVPWLGVRGGLGIVLAIVLTAWLLRVWAASYLRSTIVWSEDVRTGTLQVAGPYRFTRNPLYLGNLILAIGMGLLAPPIGTLLVVALNWIMIVFMIRVEEPALLQTSGDAYREYVRRVPRLIPTFIRSAPPAPGHPSLAAGLRTEIMIGSFVLAVFVGYLTQHPISWPVLVVFVAGVVLNEVVNREAPAREKV